MNIVAWTKKVYTDSTIRDSDIFDLLQHGNLPTGKSILRTEKGVGEIDVVAPNVDESEFAKFNVCPVGTVEVDNACLDNVKKIKPEIKIKEKAMRRYNPKTEDWEQYTKKEKVKSCPDGYVYGEETKKINIIGNPQKLKSAGIVAHDPVMDLGIDVMEERESTTIRLDVKKLGVCVKTEPMPIEYKYLENVTDSIVGWGGYAEYPFWDIDWDLMIYLAEERYRSGARFHDKEGIAVCKREYNDEFCLLFDDEKEAEQAKSELDYYDSNEFFDDSKKELEERFLEEKIEQDIPSSQKSLDNYTEIHDADRWKKLMEKAKKKYQEEMDEEITEEKIYDHMNWEKEMFWEDVSGRYPSYIGHMSYNGYGKRKDNIFLVEKYEGNQKSSKKIVIGYDL